MSIGVVERADIMVTLMMLAVSVGIAVLAYLGVPRLNEVFEATEWRVGLGFISFVVVQFLVITPIRLWRNAVWVANVEQALLELSDHRNEGVKLMNADPSDASKDDLILDMPPFLSWYGEWKKSVVNWTEKAREMIVKLMPLEASRFRNVVLYQKVLEGITVAHGQDKNILLRRIAMIENIIDRHQPSLLPE